MLRRSRDISIRTTWKGIGACGCKDDGLNCPGLFAALDIFVGEETLVQLNVIGRWCQILPSSIYCCISNVYQLINFTYLVSSDIRQSSATTSHLRSQTQAGFAGTRVKMVKSTLRHGVCCVTCRQLNILLALNEIIQ